MNSAWELRLATIGDIPVLEALIGRSVHGLQTEQYSLEQRNGALGTVFGVDTQLIRDRTYFVAEAADQIVGCGGWSCRRTLFGADRGKVGEDPRLDPATDAARLRAFFVDPAWARRGIGSEMVRLSEAAARQAGFLRIEIGATLTGVPLYEKFGYKKVGQRSVDLPNGSVLLVVLMEKQIP